MTVFRILILVLACTLLSTPETVALDPNEMFSDPKREERAREIGRQLRCMVCQNQSIFDSNADVISTATIYLAIVPFSLSGFGVMLTAVAAFNALGKPMPAMTMTFVKLFLVYIPLAWLLSRSFGPMGIFGANAVAHLSFGVVGFIMLRRMLATLAAARDADGERAEGLTTGRLI